MTKLKYKDRCLRCQRSDHTIGPSVIRNVYFPIDRRVLEPLLPGSRGTEPHEPDYYTASVFLQRRYYADWGRDWQSRRVLRPVNSGKRLRPYVKHEVKWCDWCGAEFREPLDKVRPKLNPFPKPRKWNSKS